MMAGYLRITMFFALYLPFFISAQVAINESGNAPDGSAMLEVESTQKGFLPPRMTTAQRNGISNPSEGLLIYNTEMQCLEFWNGLMWYNTNGTNFPEGSVFCSGTQTAIVEVTNPATGHTWMDRNLGASRVATSATDADAYGDQYQWGRFSDGHQCRTSSSTTTLSNQDDPGHGDFILSTSSPYDWRSPQNGSLWQGISGINNPCPNGFRLPDDSEINTEFNSWSPYNSAGAYASPLKFTVAGFRYRDNNGILGDVGISGNYWGNYPFTNTSRYLNIRANGVGFGMQHRAYGYSVRCIKD